MEHGSNDLNGYKRIFPTSRELTLKSVCIPLIRVLIVTSACAMDQMAEGRDEQVNLRFHPRIPRFTALNDKALG